MASPNTIDEFKLLKSVVRDLVEITVVALFSNVLKFGVIVDFNAPGSIDSVE